MNTVKGKNKFYFFFCIVFENCIEKNSNSVVVPYLIFTIWDILYADAHRCISNIHFLPNIVLFDSNKSYWYWPVLRIALTQLFFQFKPLSPIHIFLFHSLSTFLLLLALPPFFYLHLVLKLCQLVCDELL